MNLCKVLLMTYAFLFKRARVNAVNYFLFYFLLWFLFQMPSLLLRLPKRTFVSPDTFWDSILNEPVGMLGAEVLDENVSWVIIRDHLALHVGAGVLRPVGNCLLSPGIPSFTLLLAQPK